MSRAGFFRASRLAASALAVTLVACGSGAPAEGADEEGAITGGAIDRVHAASGLFVTADERPDAYGPPHCGGTLVAPNVVLTAAHCLGQSLKTFYLGAGVPITIFDPRSKALSKMRPLPVARATAVEVFPAFDVTKAFRPDGSLDDGYVCQKDMIDLALVRLEAPVTDIAPAPLGDAPAVGTECEAVGFSTHRDAARPYETTHERRVSKRRIREVSSYHLLSDSVDGASRQGDSGSALYCGGRITGVLSCTPKWRPDQPTWDSHARFDVIRGWIDFQIAKWQVR